MRLIRSTGLDWEMRRIAPITLICCMAGIQLFLEHRVSTGNGVLNKSACVLVLQPGFRIFRLLYNNLYISIMCTTNGQNKKALALANRYKVKLDVIEMYEQVEREKKQIGEERSKIMAIEKFYVPAYLKPDWPIVTAADQLQVMRWGMIPAKVSEKNRLKYDKGVWFANARSDKIFETYPFEYSILQHRCLVPSTGYFEYHYDSSGKGWPYFIFFENQEVFSMAGVWTEWVNPKTNEVVQSFAIITTDANPFTYQIHNGGEHPHRMPVIISPEDEKRWIDPNISKDEISSLMITCPDTYMATYPLRPDYKFFSFSDPHIIENTTNRPPLKLKDLDAA